MSTWQGPAATPPRLSWFWDAVRTQLDDVSIEAQTKPSKYIEGTGTAPYRDVELVWRRLPRGDDDKQWARVVIVPVTTPFGLQDQPGRDQVVAFLVRVDSKIPANTLADPFPVLEILQRWAFQRLHGWRPATSLEGAHVRLNVWRETPPQVMPLWDPETNVYYTSSEFRALVESPDSPTPT